MVFDLIRAQRISSSVTIDLAPATEVVLPIMGTKCPHAPMIPQRLNVRTALAEGNAWISPMTTSYFRLTETAELSSETEFIVGTPIRLGHATHRRRLVLNILADALPWQVLRNSFAAAMPQTARFFARGTIFDQHFSAAEYTYASLPTIETGMYVHHTQLFHDKLANELHPDAVTIAEWARDQGYATAVLACAGDGIYNAVMRGYDRIVVQPFTYHSYEAVERTIRTLDGMGEADHFILLHTADVHPNTQPTFQLSAAVQARLPFHQRLTADEDIVASPYLSPSPARHAAFWQSIRDTDRALGMLFAYLEENYAPEDYLVNLYSDHGVSIFSEHPHIVDPLLTGATWMMRGAGVPAGIVADELTSTVDIYPTLAHLCGFPVGDSVDGVLPRLFGGTGRDIAYSNSLYPGRTYCLRARTRTHTFHLETEDGVAPNGTVDLARAVTAIYPRTHEGIAGYEVDSPELRAFFYPRVRAFLQGIGSNGEQFPPPKEI